jgi:hypothetical protein
MPTSWAIVTDGEQQQAEADAAAAAGPCSRRSQQQVPGVPQVDPDLPPDAFWNPFAPGELEQMQQRYEARRQREREQQQEDQQQQADHQQQQQQQQQQQHGADSRRESLHYSEANWLIREAEWFAQVQRLQLENAAAQQQVASLEAEVADLQGQLGRALLKLQAAAVEKNSNHTAHAGFAAEDAAAGTRNGAEVTGSAEPACSGQPPVAPTQQQQPSVPPMQQQQQASQAAVGTRKRSAAASSGTAVQGGRSRKASRTSAAMTAPAAAAAAAAPAAMTAPAAAAAAPDLEFDELWNSMMQGAQNLPTISVYNTECITSMATLLCTLRIVSRRCQPFAASGCAFIHSFMQSFIQPEPTMLHL